MAERTIGKRQKEAAVLQLLNKLIQKKTGKIYILDLDKTNNIPIHISDKNEAESLAIAYYQLLTNCFTSSKKAKEQFKALFICDIAKCFSSADQKSDRRYRADRSMLVNGSSKDKQQIVDEYFNDCFKKMAAKKQQTEQVLDGAKAQGAIGQSKDEEDITLKDVPDVATEDEDDDFETSFDGDGQDHLDDDQDDQDDQDLNEWLTPNKDENVDDYKKRIEKSKQQFKKQQQKKNDQARENIKKLKEKQSVNQSMDRFTYKVNKYKKLLDI